MLRDEHPNIPADKKYSPAPSSSSRWLERAQQRGASARSSRVQCSSFIDDSGGGPFNSLGVRYTSPGDRSRHVTTRGSWTSSSVSPPGHQKFIEELEGLRFMQEHYKHFFTTVTQEGGGGHSVTYGAQVAPRSRPLSTPPSDAPSLYSCVDLADSLCGTLDGLTNGDGRSVAIGRRGGLCEPYGYTQGLIGRYELPSGGTDATDFIVSAADVEAERYIVRLEEEVQTLMMEISDRDHRMVVVTVAKDVVELQLQEQIRRGELFRDEITTRGILVLDFMRTLALQRKTEEAHRQMELSMQISLLKHEMKYTEAMLVQSQSREAATASFHHDQPLEGKGKEDALAHSVTATVRSLMQSDYDRLAQLVTEMPTKVQMIMSPQQGQLCRLPEPALASCGGTTASPVDTASCAAPALTNTTFAPSPVLSVKDSSHLVRLVSSVCCYFDATMDLYSAEAAQKAALVQYESDIVRLITSKQNVLTWAALYQEKKDEVKHLKEKIISLRGELRAARGQSERVIGRSPSTATVAGGTIGTQGYEAYTEPYVPPTLQRRKTSHGTTIYFSSSTQRKPRTVTAIKRPIGKLREEARRLGVLPASYYPPSVTSPSPSMSSFSASNSPSDRKTVLIHVPRDEASGKRGGSGGAAAAAAVVPVKAMAPTVAASSSPARSSAGVARSLTQRIEVEGAYLSSSSSPSESPMRQSAAPPFAAGPPLRTDDSSQCFEDTRKPPNSPVIVHHSSSSSSSSPKYADPSTLHPVLRVEALKRVSAAAAEGEMSRSSSSSSSSRHTQAEHRASMHKATTTKQKHTPKAVYNSFDDDDSDAGEVPVQGDPDKTSHLHSSSRPALSGVLAKTIVLNKATTSLSLTHDKNSEKRRGTLSSDDDTLSSSLSTTSLSLVPLKTQPDRLRISAQATAKGAHVDPRSSHMRRSSFDEDDSPSGGADDSSSRNKALFTQVPSLRTTVVSKTVGTPILTTQSSAAPPQPRLAPTATTATTATDYGRTALMSSAAKPTKLKLPTW
ncbi:hypothetical protein JKF63_01556 [Porcisia hertigi]|uniref:Uncharacterized protein n=1 Tax=Porcisia hertigi TaxID=2761500 RepID=A0A836HYA3_9TRYP|nr:hypothetical protein JKF63_01556 [Porcisia hertigi]